MRSIASLWRSQNFTKTSKPLKSRAFRVLRGKNQPSFTIAAFPRPLGLERVTFVVELFEVLCYNIFERKEMQ